MLESLTLAVAACAGSGHGNAVPFAGGPSGLGAQKKSAAVSLRMVIPASTTAVTGAAKRREYVSASVASIVYQITAAGSTGSLVSGANYANVAASPSPCTTPSA